MDAQWVAKLTIPYRAAEEPPGFSAFGMIPRLLRLPLVDLRGEGDAGHRESIEFFPATPLEYLDRWAAANEVFGDAVALQQVIEWVDGHVSFGVRQPYYAGTPASQIDVDAHFVAEGWTPLTDPTQQHSLFYNYAFQVLAIDAVPRNCFERDGYLMPFDVILRPRAGPGGIPPDLVTSLCGSLRYTRPAASGAACV